MRHTMTMGVLGRFTIPVELPSIPPEVDSQMSIFDAGANRRYGRFNNLLAPLRTWSWSHKVLSKKISNQFTPLLDPGLRNQFWFLMPCGYGVNRLSPSDSFLAGKSNVFSFTTGSSVHELAGGHRATKVMQPDATGATYTTVFDSVPIPESGIPSTSPDSVNVGFWFWNNGTTGNGKAKISLTTRDGVTTDVIKDLPTVSGWQCFTYNFTPRKSTDTPGQAINQVTLAATGSITLLSPFFHQADPTDPMKIYKWEPGTGAYRVVITHVNRWQYSLYADYLDLTLVELSQLAKQR